jgi:hypothetical protein
MCSSQAEIDGRRQISKKGSRRLAMVTGSVLRGLGCSGGPPATGSNAARSAPRTGALGGVGLLWEDSMSANRRWPAARLRLQRLGLARCLRGAGRARRRARLGRTAFIGRGCGVPLARTPRRGGRRRPGRVRHGHWPRPWSGPGWAKAGRGWARAGRAFGLCPLGKNLYFRIYF